MFAILQLDLELSNDIEPPLHRDSIQWIRSAFRVIASSVASISRREMHFPNPVLSIAIEAVVCGRLSLGLARRSAPRFRLRDTEK